MNTQKVINRCLGKNNEVECWLCGKEIDYPTYRHGNPLCAKCAEKADKAQKK